MGHPVPDDTRGIVDPAAMFEVVAFRRYPAGPALTGLVEWFWSVSWALPAGQVHHQQVLNHPAGNISVGTVDDSGIPLDPPEGRVYGVLNRLSHRRLTGSGWTVAARSTVGGLGALLDRPAREAAGRQLTLGEALPGVEPDLVDSTSRAVGTTAVPAGVERLRQGLEAAVARRSSALIDEARWVVAVARLAETDRTICRVEHLADRAGVSVRSLQRHFDRHVGAGPSFVIRRWRIIEAAEAVRSSVGDEWPGWSTVAARLGYADQAHLSRDFRHCLGVTPSEYLRQVRAG
ncbi:MAG: helix-turn-helix domain-containing protein [Acidimicrobiales bacterium]